MKIRISFLLSILALLVAVQSVSAVAPTREAIEKWVAEGVWKQKVDDLKAFNASGGNQPPAHSPLDRSHLPPSMATSDAQDTLRICVILVDFSDLDSDVGVVSTAATFDSLLFSNRKTDQVINATGSMTDYYLENSYGKVLIEGDVFGWYQMPSTYDYYVGPDDGLTRGRELARDAIVYAKNFGGADFSQYDNNGDGYCDGVVIIHAGPGAEEGADPAIWSHQGNLNTPIVYDNVVISEYTMNPEESQGQLSAIGVFCHEYGHQLGLMDYYDIDYDPASSDGLGAWSLMASGNYNGGSRVPASLDAYSRIILGWASMVEVTENMSQVEFPAVEYNPVVYRLRNAITGAGEYWLVENRQPYGFDAGLPGWGLMIYHIDLAAPGNTNYLRYMVALEQADGANDLAMTVGNGGDGGDPWPGATNNRDFHEFSSPNSNTNEYGLNFGEVSTISVWDISDSDSLMYADLDITYSRPWETPSGSEPFSFDESGPGGNGNGYLEPGETINLYGTFTNEMRETYNARLSASTGRPEVTFVNNDVALASTFNFFEASNLDAIKFTLAPSFVPIIDSFYITVTSDSLPGTPGSSEFSRTFGVEVSLGLPQILIVDDDRGDNFEERYTDVIHARRIPYEVWNTDNLGSPTGADLLNYPMVFWHTGDSTVGALNAADIQAMKTYLDGSGNLFLSTISGAADIANLDPAFLTNYLGAELDTVFLFPRFTGVAGNQVGDGTRYIYGSGVSGNGLQYINAVNGSDEAFGIDLPGYTCGVTRHSSYNLVFLTFPMEYLSDTRTGYNTTDDMIGRVLDFFGGIPTDVEDDNPGSSLPGSFSLAQNYPNPFNPTTTIAYTIRPTGGTSPEVDLSVFNMLGQKVTTLVSGRQIPGNYEVVWDGTSQSGTPVASGVYFYRLTHGDNTDTKKMVLLK